MTEQRRTIGDAHPYHQVMVQFERESATQSFQYHLERRDRLGDRLRFGSLALNVGSLLGFLTFLDNKSTVKWSEAIDHKEAVIVFFLFGIIASSIAILLASYRAISDANIASSHLQSVENLQGQLSKEFTAENVTNARKSLAEYQQSVRAGFSNWKSENMLASAAGSSWVAGISWCAWRLAQLVDWSGPAF